MRMQTYGMTWIAGEKIRIRYLKLPQYELKAALHLLWKKSLNLDRNGR